MANEVAGIDVLIYVTISSVKTLVGGQRGATISHRTEVADAKHKSSGAWQNRVQTFLDWSISGDAVIIEDDATRAELRRAWRAREDVEVEVRYPDGIRETGLAVIADLSDNAPHDGVATMTLQLDGNGPLTEVDTDTLDYTVSVIPNAANGGNGTFAATPVEGPSVQLGNYILECIIKTASAGTFSVYAPDGSRLPDLVVGVAYNNGHFSGTLQDGSNDFNVGDIIIINVIETP